MYLMVYFHHKSIIYEEMLHRYLTSPDCTYLMPAAIEDYVKATDYSLYEHLGSVSNRWARRIADRNPFKMLFEHHETEPTPRAQLMEKALHAEGVEVIRASSKARLSKYHATQAEQGFTIYVVDQYDLMEKPIPIEQCTQIFHRYEDTRRIERLYVPPEDYARARRIMMEKRL